MSTVVVNVKHARNFDVYIGRVNETYGLPESPFANPFRVGRDGTREDVIDQYREHLLARPDLLAALPGLCGKRLGCWCATPLMPELTAHDLPYRCHGQVVAELADA